MSESHIFRSGENAEFFGTDDQFLDFKPKNDELSFTVGDPVIYYFDNDRCSRWGEGNLRDKPQGYRGKIELITTDLVVRMKTETPLPPLNST
jgi:hypothetical protein